MSSDHGQSLIYHHLFILSKSVWDMCHWYFHKIAYLRSNWHQLLCDHIPSIYMLHGKIKATLNWRNPIFFKQKDHIRWILYILKWDGFLKIKTYFFPQYYWNKVSKIEKSDICFTTCYALWLFSCLTIDTMIETFNIYFNSRY